MSKHESCIHDFSLMEDTVRQLAGGDAEEMQMSYSAIMIPNQKTQLFYYLHLKTIPSQCIVMNTHFLVIEKRRFADMQPEITDKANLRARGVSRVLRPCVPYAACPRGRLHATSADLSRHGTRHEIRPTGPASPIRPAESIRPVKGICLTCPMAEAMTDEQ